MLTSFNSDYTPDYKSTGCLNFIFCLSSIKTCLSRPLFDYSWLMKSLHKSIHLLSSHGGGLGGPCGHENRGKKKATVLHHSWSKSLSSEGGITSRLLIFRWFVFSLFMIIVDFYIVILTCADLIIVCRWLIHPRLPRHLPRHLLLTPFRRQNHPETNSHTFRAVYRRSFL